MSTNAQADETANELKDDAMRNASVASIIFGAGCFWGVEAALRAVDGVVNTTCGYAGGHVADPTYEMVCRGTTGHAEVVLVEYDTARLALDDLLNVFWHCHDPTTQDRQGPDIGTQYRSAIYYFTALQRDTITVSLENQQRSGRWQSPIVTEVLPAGRFYPAEDYHQRYFEKRGILR